ncbi:RNA binding protein (contains ribosomal protein S1 domain) [Legionella steigerwaltii]|uniref:RNA binding protein (Contains ribosomal protein S1 domain) n=1 Tax=Legionella steigerwaltii TaxID=460 RepID=A0A378L978_9GAMM|nr:hypothetical protein [Legionella steigerwaltii]KTD80326.1 RNA binding protein (contains ribosomal protein S1 domain) [Legionella steigerwaltii]STY22408.1 RNA binding protein (contains ribosomal protein S1 domain) [Legionella steigerwaltii]
MIILYIPYSEENDLMTKALHWKEVLSNQNIRIIQHGKKIDYKSMEHVPLTIYVLAHGIDNLLENFHLASDCPITDRTTLLGIDKIAERFNSDFLYLHHRISNIKLYFCNNKGNQKSIAEKFQQNLILFDAFIDYYAGTLFCPSTDKKKYSIYNGQWYVSSNVRHTLYKRMGEDSNVKMSIKQLSMLNFFEDAKQKRIDLMFERQKKARQEQLMKKRKELLEYQQMHGGKMELDELCQPPNL